MKDDADLEEYARHSRRMRELVKEIPGFISIKGFIAEDGEEISIARFKSETYANLVLEGASTIDQAKRKGIYRKINEILLDEAFSLSVAPRIDLFLLSGRTKSVRFSVDNMPYLGEAWQTA